MIINMFGLALLPNGLATTRSAARVPLPTAADGTYRAMSCRAGPCRAVPCRAMPCHAMPCCRAVPCRAMPCHACRAVPCHTTPCHTTPQQPTVRAVGENKNQQMAGGAVGIGPRSVGVSKARPDRSSYRLKLCPRRRVRGIVRCGCQVQHV